LSSILIFNSDSQTSLIMAMTLAQMRNVRTIDDIQGFGKGYTSPTVEGTPWNAEEWDAIVVPSFIRITEVNAMNYIWRAHTGQELLNFVQDTYVVAMSQNYKLNDTYAHLFEAVAPDGEGAAAAVRYSNESVVPLEFREAHPEFTNMTPDRKIIFASLIANTIMRVGEKTIDGTVLRLAHLHVGNGMLEPHHAADYPNAFVPAQQMLDNLVGSFIDDQHTRGWLKAYIQKYWATGLLANVKCYLRWQCLFAYYLYGFGCIRYIHSASLIVAYNKIIEVYWDTSVFDEILRFGPIMEDIKNSSTSPHEYQRAMPFCKNFNNLFYTSTTCKQNPKITSFVLGVLKARNPEMAYPISFPEEIVNPDYFACGLALATPEEEFSNAGCLPARLELLARMNRNRAPAPEAPNVDELPDDDEEA